jgi:putative membrane protein insertion efficiency factor
VNPFDLLERALRAVLIALVRGYRFFLSPWLGSACRFEPTCSRYALQALERHGAWRGGALTAWRVLRCHPWCAGGHDPVPGAHAARGLFTGLRARPPASQAEAAGVALRAAAPEILPSTPAVASDTRKTSR